MADVSKLKVESSTYDIKDATARTDLTNLLSIYSGALGDGTKISINGNSIYYTSAVVSFTDNIGYIDITALGLTYKPRCVVLTCCNQPLAMQYDYDNSSNTSIKTVLIGSAYSGLIRCSIVLATNE